MPAPPIVFDRHRRIIEAALTALDYPVDAIFARAGFSRRVGEPGDDSGVSVYEFSAGIFCAATEATGDDAVAFRCGTVVPFGCYAVIDYLTGSCTTVGDAMTMLAKYFSVISPNIRWSIEESGDAYVLGIEAMHPSESSRLSFLGFTLGVTFSRFRELTASPLSFTNVTLKLPRPRHVQPYEDMFGAVTFDAADTTFHLSAESWSAPLVPRGAELHTVFRQQADEKMAANTNGPIAARVRVAIRHVLPKGAPKLGDIAKQLATSERTLQRRLKDADVSFQELVDDERLATATDCLKNASLTVADVAYLVGYSEPSAFVRAFKRWTGHPPSAARS